MSRRSAVLTRMSGFAGSLRRKTGDKLCFFAKYSKKVNFLWAKDVL